MKEHSPCDEWMEMLALKQEDLSASEYAALQAHLDHCLACQAAQKNYVRLIARIHELSPSATKTLLDLKDQPHLKRDTGGVRKQPSLVSSPIPFQSKRVATNSVGVFERVLSGLFVAIIILVSLILFRPGHFTTNLAPTQAPMLTFKVQRTAAYAGLEFTLVNAQYATTFLDDDIHSGSGVVRLNLKVANNSSDQINIVYYNIARLLAPKLSPITPTNVSLSVGPKPHTSETGWLDFSVSSPLQLNALQLQLGSTTLGESLVKIPLSGPFDASRNSDRTSPQNLDISYYFPYDNPQLLIYHLKSVDIRNAYRGSQAKAGQQYYVLNFQVDNPNGTSISPGFGYVYIRLSFNGGPIHPPIDNTLPYGFNALAKGVGGRVVFTGPAGLKAITIDFLIQYQHQSGGPYYNVTL